MTLLRRGAQPKVRKIHEVRVLTKTDLESLRVRRDTPVVQRYRDSHHMIARLMAAGIRNDVIAEKCGYSHSRVAMFSADPAFNELVAHYRGIVTEDFKDAIQDFVSLATSNMMKAERQLSEKLDQADENGELLPTRDLLAIRADSADRVGFGKKQTNVNVNVDFAAKLEGAIARSGKVIEAVARPRLQSPLAPPPAPRPQGEAPAPAPVLEGTFLRRA